MLVESFSFDALISLVAVLSNASSRCAPMLTDHDRNIFCNCLASILKVILRHLKGRNSSKTVLDNHSKSLLLSLLTWTVCCGRNPCPSYELRKQVVRRLVFCTFSLQECYLVRDVSYRFDALEWIAKHCPLDSLSNALQCFVHEYLDESKNWIIQQNKQSSKRRRLSIVEKDDVVELLMQLGILLVDRWRQEGDNNENWIKVVVMFLHLLEQQSVVLDNILETSQHNNWKDALSCISDLLWTFQGNQPSIMTWQGILSLATISFSTIMTKTEQILTCISQLDDYSLCHHCIYLQVFGQLLYKYSERRQLNVFLDKLCTNMANESVALASLFPSNFVSCMTKTTPEEFSDCFHIVLQYFLSLYKSSRTVHGKKEDSMGFYLQLMLFLFQSLLQKLSKQESSSLYWICLHETFEECISPLFSSSAHDSWKDSLSCVEYIPRVTSCWMSCACYALLLFPNDKNVKTEYLEQLLSKLEELTEHWSSSSVFTSLSTCAHWLELLTNWLSTRNKVLKRNKSTSLSSKCSSQQLVIQRWLIPCITCIRDYLYSMKWNESLLLSSSQVFEHLWASLQHIAAYFLTCSSRKVKKYFSIWMKLFFPLLLVVSFHCHVGSRNNAIPRWILDDWSKLVDRLLDWSVMETVWEQKHFRNKLLGYWKCVVRGLCGEWEEESRRNMWIRPWLDSLSKSESCTLLHYLWDNGIVPMIVRFPWMLSNSFVAWIGKHYVSNKAKLDNTFQGKIEKFLCDFYLVRSRTYSGFRKCIIAQPAILLALVPYVPTQASVSRGWLQFLKWFTKKHSESCHQLQNWLSEMMQQQYISSNSVCHTNGLLYLVITFWQRVSQPPLGKILKENILQWIPHLWVSSEYPLLEKIEALRLVLQYGKKKKFSFMQVYKEMFDRAFEMLFHDRMDIDAMSNRNYSMEARRFLSCYFLWKKEAILSLLKHDELTSLLVWYLEPLGDDVYSAMEQDEDILQLRQLSYIPFWKQVLESCWLQLVPMAVYQPTKFLIVCRLCYLFLMNFEPGREKDRKIVRELYHLFFKVSITKDENLSNMIQCAGAIALDCLNVVASKVHYSESMEEYEDAMSNLFLVRRWYLTSNRPRRLPITSSGSFVPWEQICQLFSRSMEKLRKSSQYSVSFVCNFAFNSMELLLKETEPFPYVAWIRRLWEPLLGWTKRGLSATWLTWFLFQVVDLIEQQKPALLHEPLFIAELSKLLQCQPEETLASGNLLHPKESVVENVRYFLQQYSERYKYKGKA